MQKGLVKYAFMLLAVSALTATAVRADTPGQKTYQAKCAGCHGADGKGQTGAGKALGAHDFTSPEIQKMSDEDLTKIIADGKNKMPPYGKSLSASEIKDLVAYIRGFAKK